MMVASRAGKAFTTPDSRRGILVWLMHWDGGAVVAASLDDPSPSASRRGGADRRESSADAADSPGMYRSTGTQKSAPSCCSGWSMYGPPLMAQAPTAITIFGSRNGVVGLLQRQAHVRRDGPGDQQPVGVARRGDVLDSEAADVPADRGQHVGVGLAGVAAAGAHHAQLQRTPEEPPQATAQSRGQTQFVRPTSRSSRLRTASRWSPV